MIRYQLTFFSTPGQSTEEPRFSRSSIKERSEALSAIEKEMEDLAKPGVSYELERLLNIPN
jgi:hypothetical protein